MIGIWIVYFQKHFPVFKMGLIRYVKWITGKKKSDEIANCIQIFSVSIIKNVFENGSVKNLVQLRHGCLLFPVSTHAIIVTDYAPL